MAQNAMTGKGFNEMERGAALPAGYLGRWMVLFFYL
jgi:hypothetical protein